VRRSHFLGITPVAGARALIHPGAIETSLAPEKPASPPEATQSGTGEATPADLDTLLQTVGALLAQVAQHTRSISCHFTTQ